MLDHKIILNQFPKWTSEFHDYYKYIVCGKEGIFATDLSRVIYTDIYKLYEYRLYDSLGNNHTSEIEIPKVDRFSNAQEFIKNHLFENFNCVMKSNSKGVYSKRVIMLTLDALRMMRQTMNYIISMNKKDLSKPLYIKIKSGKIYFMTHTNESTDVKVCFDIDLDMEWEGFFNASYIKNFIELLIATKTLDFNLDILNSTVPDLLAQKTPGLLIKSNEFTAIISGLKPSEKLIEYYSKLFEVNKNV